MMIQMNYADKDKTKPIRIRVPPGAIDDKIPEEFNDLRQNFIERPVFYDAESVLKFYRRFGKEYDINLIFVDTTPYWELYPKKAKD